MDYGLDDTEIASYYGVTVSSMRRLKMLLGVG